MKPDFQQCGILISVDSDEPVQTPIKHDVRVIEYRQAKALIRLPAHAQAGQGFAGRTHCWKSNVAAHI